MKPIIITERLYLRKFNETDAEFILQLLNSPGWLKFIGDRNVRTREQAVNYLTDGPIKSYKLNGFGLSLVVLRFDETPIGMCGLIRRDTLKHPDIGFAFLPGYSGMGYACEIAKATLYHAQNNLKLQTILAITVPHNDRSINLLNKIGMQFDKVIQLPTSTEELLLFSNSGTLSNED